MKNEDFRKALEIQRKYESTCDKCAFDDFINELTKDE